MKKDLSGAICLLQGGAYTCALYKDGKAYTSSERGILPLLKWVLAKAPLQGFSAADKVVGKAAAFLYALMEVDGVYAQVMSEGAYQTLLRHGIQPFYGLRVPGIINRTGDGPCPMEQAVRDVQNAGEALVRIQETLAAITQQRNKLG